MPDDVQSYLRFDSLPCGIAKFHGNGVPLHSIRSLLLPSFDKEKLKVARKNALKLSSLAPIEQLGMRNLDGSETKLQIWSMERSKTPQATVVMVGGVMSYPRIWQTLVKLLQETFECKIVMFPGEISHPDKVPQDVHTDVTALRNFITDHLNTEQCILIGHAEGCQICDRVVTQEGLRNLAYIRLHWFMHRAHNAYRARLLKLTQGRIAATMHKRPVATVNYLLNGISTQIPSHEHIYALAMLFDEGLQQTVARARQFDQLEHLQWFHGNFRHADAPVYALQGTEDMFMHASLFQRHSSWPKACKVEFCQGGYFLPIENPEKVAAVIKRAHSELPALG